MLVSGMRESGRAGATALFQAAVEQFARLVFPEKAVKW